VTQAVVVGGSIAGLASALALARAGVSVRVLERDPEPLPDSAESAFAHWQRRGTPQLRHSHGFLARLRGLLREREPELLASLLANGAEEIRFTEIVKKVLPDAELLPADEEIALLGCRRTCFEWVLRRYVTALPGVELHSGVSVSSLSAVVNGGVPRVTGVRTSEGELAADLVIDASGRRSRLRHWLAAAGARRPREHSEPCGIFYSSRFYRGRDGAERPLLDGPMGADYGYLKIGVFPGDAHSWSVTLAASPDDDALRALTQPEVFDAVAAWLPMTAAWVDPAVAVPISGVTAMSGLRNTRRFLVEAGEPLALGVAAVGDALIHTNPIVGRGCTLAFVNAYLMADAWRDAEGDLRGFALALDAAVEREMAPWYHGQLVQDRDAILVMEQLRDGGDPYRVNRDDGSVDPAAYLRVLMRDGLGPALREDAVLLRAFLRIFNLLDAPTDLMKDPAIVGRILGSYARRDTRPPAPQPTRAEVVERIATAPGR
jgi:2-polyprenyl-6-methoxyphenol hydroxylase-like FAD-dependent oxidoreductase